uniref:ANK_REP_REGION domain-containing protein n=2 Tax=Caenorhabditis tropicalis TaxID=1561998 RepID=A0A1I7TQL1_9PELO
MGKVPKSSKKEKKGTQRKIRQSMDQEKVNIPKKNNGKIDKRPGGKKTVKLIWETEKPTNRQEIGNNQKTPNTNGQPKYQNANAYKKLNQAKMDFIEEPLKSRGSPVKRPPQKPQNMLSRTREPVQTTQTTSKVSNGRCLHLANFLVSKAKRRQHSRLDTNEIGPPDVPITTRRFPDEGCRLLNNERSRQDAFEDEMERALKELEVEVVYGSTGVNKSDSKVEEDTLLSDYEDSLKLSEKEKTELNEIGEEIKRMREEAKRIKEATVKMKQRSNNSSVGNFADLDAQDAAFRKELEEQNRKFEEVMRKLREQRREKERLAQEEFEQIRLETARNIAAFLACIQLKLRFEDEEQKWGDQLSNLRKPLITVTTSYYNLQDELRNVDYTDDFSRSCVESEGNLFAKKVVDAQKMLSIAFDNLESLTENYDDRIFIKIIMKSISEQGHICNEIGEELVKVLKERANHRKLDDLVQKLNRHAIPTTGALKRMSVVARDLDYLDIPCVPGPQWLRFFK